MIHAETARRIAIIDFEASTLPLSNSRSYPVEVAAGIPETGEIRTWLIRPKREWLDIWDRSKESERIHGLSQQHLLNALSKCTK